MFLPRYYENGVVNILKLLERELLAIPFRLKDELSVIRTLLVKYKDIPISLADGYLISNGRTNYGQRRFNVRRSEAFRQTPETTELFRYASGV